MKDFFVPKDLLLFSNSMGINSDFSVRGFSVGEAEDEGTLTVTVSATAGGGLWTPAEIMTSLWLDASDDATISLNGSTVSQWADKSGNGKHVTQGTSDYQPSIGSQNDLNTISFDGVNDFLATYDAILSTDYTIFMVVKNCVLSQTALAVGQGTSSATGRMYVLAEYGSSLCVHSVNSGAHRIDGTPVGGHKVYALTRSGTSSVIKINGGAAIAGSVKSVTVQNTAFTIGKALGSCGAIDMCELVVMPNVAPIGCIQRVEGYFAHKWGLAANLSSGHPYKSSPPTI